MTKLIVEMDMPKSCPCDLIGVGYAMWCSAASGIPKRVAEYDECVKNGTRPDWCPIVGVLPDKHGDLIDRDETFHAAQPQGCTDEHWAETTLGRVVLGAKTIVAAERKEDEQID